MSTRCRCGGRSSSKSTTRPRRRCCNAGKRDGHWVFELEADATIPAEYVLLRHYRGEPIDADLEQKIADYLRRIQGAHGGWALFHEGDFDMSASVKAYFALKMIGESPDAPHMRRAREAILSRGGAVHSNVFTRVLLSLYGVLDWRSVPEMPVEIMLLPRWFPFHLSKVSYWARTVLVPLLVLQALRPRAKNPLGVRIDELFVEPPASIGPAREGAAPTLELVPVLSRRRCHSPAGREHLSQSDCASARSIGRSLSSPSGSTAKTGSARSFPRWRMRR